MNVNVNVFHTSTWLTADVLRVESSVSNLSFEAIVHFAHTFLDKTHLSHIFSTFCEVKTRTRICPSIHKRCRLDARDAPSKQR